PLTQTGSSLALEPCFAGAVRRRGRERRPRPRLGASLGSAVGGGWVELFERLDRGGEQDAETLARRGAHVGRGAGEAMEDRMTNGFVRARKRREELPEPERMIEDDRFEHRCVRIRGALV